MNRDELEVSQFYKLKTGNGVTSIFIVAVEDFYYQLGFGSNAKSMNCEKYIYWDCGSRVFGSFTYLDKHIIDNLTLGTNMCWQRNMKNHMKNTLEEDKENMQRWFDAREQALNEFCSLNTLPE